MYLKSLENLEDRARVLNFDLANLSSLVNVGDLPGFLSFLVHIYKYFNRPPKPSLEVISFELENYDLMHRNKLIIAIRNKSKKQMATGLSCVWFIQEEDSYEQIDTSTNRPNKLENISRATIQKPIISKSKLDCDPRIHFLLKKDRNYNVIGQVSCDQLQKAVKFNLPLIQLPKTSMLDSALGKRVYS